MDITTFVVWTIVLLSVVVCWVAFRGDKPDATPKSKNIALRDSAALALSSYWSHYYDGWSLALFRDAAGAVCHVACGVPDGTYFDSGGFSKEEQIAKRFGFPLTAESCDEADVQSLLGANNSVLEAAEDLRHSVEGKTS
jgi:hypothetical protein